MAIPATAPAVVPKTRTTTIGGQTFERQTLTLDVQAQGLADLRWMLRSIAANETAQQVRLHNPPSAVVVDNRPAREFDDAQRKVVVLYGTRLATAAMRLVETTLRQNIIKTTFRRSGRLQDISGSWRWRLIIPGAGSRVVTAGSELPTFVRGSILVLEPFGAPHATRVNQLVIAGGQLMSRRRSRETKQKQPLGFLRATVEALRARQEFRQFAVTVVFTKQHAVPGELSRKQGTGAIVIQLKRR
jgi:hypothetical protein